MPIDDPTSAYLWMNATSGVTSPGPPSAAGLSLLADLQQTVMRRQHMTTCQPLALPDAW